MLAEARGGTPLSDYELGTAVQGMLEGGLWPSKRRAAEALGLTLHHLSGALAVAQLPAPVLGAFDWPTAIRPVWVSKLLVTYERDPAGFPQRVALARAGTVRAADARSIYLAVTASE